MPVNQYDQPLRYQYKSRGLEKLAKPLAAMQQQYDTTQGELSDTDFDLKYLPYGSDPMQAKSIISGFEEKRDKIASDLMVSKNFRKSAQDLKNLNKNWFNHPEAQALQNNYNQWQTSNKSQKERVDSGNLSRDQYQEWQQRSINEFTTKGGTSYSGENEWNRLGRQERLEDLEKDIEKTRLDIAKAQPEKVGDAFNSAGVQLNEDEIMRVKTIWKSKNPNEIAKETEKYLRGIPRYRKYYEELGDYSYWNKTQSPEGRKATSKELLSQYNKSLKNALTSAKESGKKGDTSYTDNDQFKEYSKKQADVQKMLDSGEYDENLVKGIFNQGFMDQKYDSKVIGDILGYKNITHNYQVKNIPGGGSGSDLAKNNPFMAFVPGSEEPLKISNLSSQIGTSGKNLYAPIKELNNIATMRPLVMGWKGSEHRKNMSRNPGEMMATQTKIISLRNQSKNAEDFQAKMWNAGIREGNNASNASKLFDALGKDGAMQAATNTLGKAQQTYNNYTDAKRQMNYIEDAAAKDPMYALNIGNIGSSDITLKKNIPKELLDLAKKKGYLHAPQGQGMVGIEKYTSGAITLDNLARLKGYDNYADAAKQGASFAKYTTNTVYAKDTNLAKQRFINNATDANIMTHQLINNPTIEKGLGAMFTQAGDLTSFIPAFTAKWSNQPGFTEEGRLASGTVLDIKKGRPVQLIKHGSRLLYKVPVKIMNEDTGKLEAHSVVVQPKMGTDPMNSQALNMIDEGTADVATPLGEQTNDMAKAMKYDLKNGNTFTQNLYEAIPSAVGKERPPVLETIPIPNRIGTNLEFIKAKDGLGNPVIQIRSINQTGTIANYTENGKLMQYESVNAAKVAASKMLGY